MPGITIETDKRAIEFSGRTLKRRWRKRPRPIKTAKALRTMRREIRAEKANRLTYEVGQAVFIYGSHRIATVLEGAKVGTKAEAYLVEIDQEKILVSNSDLSPVDEETYWRNRAFFSAGDTVVLAEDVSGDTTLKVGASMSMLDGEITVLPKGTKGTIVDIAGLYEAEDPEGESMPGYTVQFEDQEEPWILAEDTLDKVDEDIYDPSSSAFVMREHPQHDKI